MKISLLGQFQVSKNGKVIKGFASDKVRALLAYLVTEAHCPHRREILANLLWPDKPEHNARANLRRALSNLRTVLDDRNSDPPFLLISRQDIQINTGDHFWSDTSILNNIYSQLDQYSENTNNVNQILDIYHGEFLEGFHIPDSMQFEEWLLMRREQFSRKVDDILTQTCIHFEGQNDYKAALPYAWCHVEKEPWQEGARRQLMRLLVVSGQREEAIKQYYLLIKLLKKDLDVEPEPETIHLFSEIKSGDFKLISNQRDSTQTSSPVLPDFLQNRDTTPMQPRDLFISRKEELKNLHNCIESIQDERGKIRFVVGEAGSGKSMLIQEFVRQAQIKDKTLISAIGLCNAFTGIGDPYLPFREILYQLCGDIKHRLKTGIISHDYAVRLWNTIPTICQALISYGPDLIGTIIPSQSLKEFTSPIKMSHPALYNKLNVLIDQKISSQGVSLTQVNLFSQFTTVLNEISHDNPLLLVIDDIQWADTGTISLLFHLGKQLSGTNITIIGSYRPEEVITNKEHEQHPLDPVIQELKRIYGDIFIHLDDSSNAQFIEDYISSEPNKLSRTFLESLQKHTGGNPLFIAELIRDLKEIGVLGKDENGFWISKHQIKIESLPPKIEGIIRERFNRLPKILQRILSIASIEGENFTAEIIAEIENLSKLQTINLLSEQLSKQHNLIKAHQIKLVAGNNLSIYRFRHILIQKFIYNQLDQIELRDLHERVGTTMESVVEKNKEEFYVTLARHFQKANIHEKAASYYFDAGERAVILSGYMEAINHYKKSIESIQSIPETQERNQFELNVQLKLGLAYQATRGFANEMVGVAYKRSLELCQSVQDINKKIITLQLLFSYYSNMAEFKTTDEVMTLLEKNTYEMEDPIPSYVLQIHWGKGYLESLFGNHVSALEHFEKALDYYEKGPHLQIEENMGMEAGIYCHSWAALHSTWAGFLERANKHCQTALKIADEKNIKLFTADSLWFSTWVNVELNNYDKAWEFCEPALDLAIKENYYLTEALVRMFKGRILSNNGNHEEAIDSVKLALQMFQNIGAISAETSFLHGLAEVYCNAGKVDEGFEIIQRAEEIINTSGECRHQVALQRLKGNLYLQAGDDFNAEKAYVSSIKISQNQSAKLLELETAIDLFKLWQRQGKLELAKDMLSEIVNWFSEGIDNPMLIKARSLLNKF